MLTTCAYYAFKVNLLYSIMLQKLINNDGKYSKKLRLQRHTEKGTIRIVSLLKVKQSSKEDCCLFVNEICNREKTRSATAKDGCTPEYCADSNFSPIMLKF